MSQSKSVKKGPHGKVIDLETAIRRVVLPRDSRYDVGAYIFIYESLNFTQKLLGRDDPALAPHERHVSGQELVEGIRRYADQLFGPLAPAVFRSWGLHTTRDFGQLVFNLVEGNLLGKTDEDRIEDFENGFDFDTAFENSINPQLQ